MSSHLPAIVVNIVSQWLSVEEVGQLRKVCKDFRHVGFNQYLTKHWKLTRNQSRALYYSPLAKELLGPDTAIHTLDLSGTKVIDVSMCGNVYSLSLRWTDVIDVSMLGNVHTLHLSGTKVVDVSMLGNVYVLNLFKSSVIDVSMLGNVKHLMLPNGKFVGRDF